LSLYLERCQRRLVAEVGRRLRVVARPVDYVDTVDVIELNKIRSTPKQPIHSHIGDFDRDVAYNSWAKNLYSHAWFDTSTEFAAAQAIDAGTDVVVWARLHRNDVPIQWTHEGRTYNPDFVVVEQSSGRTLSWLVETKQNREMESEEVQSKRLAARAWANTLNSLNPDDGEWRYLLLSETDVFDARGSWSQLKGFGR
ncbi:restriction endonuclease, partial [Rhodococcus aetherivorans]